VLLKLPSKKDLDNHDHNRFMTTMTESYFCMSLSSWVAWKGENFLLWRGKKALHNHHHHSMTMTAAMLHQVTSESWLIMSIMTLWAHGDDQLLLALYLSFGFSSGWNCTFFSCSSASYGCKAETMSRQLDTQAWMSSEEETCYWDDP
jgi:hypothetical protein